MLPCRGGALVVGTENGTDKCAIEFTVRVWYEPQGRVIHIAGPEGMGIELSQTTRHRFASTPSCSKSLARH